MTIDIYHPWDVRVKISRTPEHQFSRLYRNNCTAPSTCGVAFAISFIIFAAFREVRRFSNSASMLRRRAPSIGVAGAVGAFWTSLPPQKSKKIDSQSFNNKLQRLIWVQKVGYPKKTWFTALKASCSSYLRGNPFGQTNVHHLLAKSPL